MRDFINKNIKVIIILIVVISIATIGLTLAYTMNDISVSISSGEYNVVYTGSATLPTSKLQPILDSAVLSSSKILKIQFTVKGASTNPTTKPIIYDVSLTNLNIPFEARSEYLKWMLYKNGTKISEGNFSSDFDVIANNRLVLTNTQQDLPDYSSTADSYIFYMWISESCTDSDILNCTTDMDLSYLTELSISGAIRIELSTGSKKTLVRPKPAADTIMALASTGTSGACAAGGTGVCATNSYTENSTTKYHDYRYRGGEPNNYVVFNNDMYRIIGVFDDYTHGVEGQYLVKLIKASSLYSGTWGKYSSTANLLYGTYLGYSNDWTGNKSRFNISDNTSPANANIMLNEYFYNKKDNSSVYGYCHNWSNFYSFDEHLTGSCTDIVGHGISSNYRNYIQKSKWYLNGNFTDNNLTKRNYYLYERGKCTDGGCISANSGDYDVSTENYIGLMYPSDYLYASSYKNVNDTTILSNSLENGTSNWLYNGMEWTITTKNDNSTGVIAVNINGAMASYQARYAFTIRPVLYLKSVIGIVDGSGTVDDPYILS